MDTNIISKIKKLLTLSANSTEHEAALAASMAQNLMLKYKLSMSEIEVAESEKSPVSEAFVTEKMGKFTYMMWKGTLIHGISLLNGCRTLRHPGNRIQLIGRESDRQVVEYLACFLIREVERLSFEDFARQGFPSMKDRWTWVQSFGSGATRIILQRMKDEQRQMQQTDARVTALVLREDKAVANFMAANHRDVRAGRGKVNVRSEALVNGSAAGRSIQWRGAMNGGAQRSIA